jgi:FlaA1/EpsC-like NDP-sugar epimerase
VFGAGDAGAQLIRRLATQSGAAYRPVAILDDDPVKRRLRIGGVPVLGGQDKMAAAAVSTGAKVLVIAIARPSGRVIQDLTVAAERCGLIPKVIPSVMEVLTRGARIEGVRDPRISDLPRPRATVTEVAAVRGHIAGRRLVTGAGGSIGAELCRQLHQFEAELIMLADIGDQRRVRELFGRFRPEIVFHAAALNHPPRLVLPETGLVRATAGGWHLRAGVGPPCPRSLPGHGDADTFGCLLFVDGVPLLVDTGTTGRLHLLRRRVHRDGRQ